MDKRRVLILCTGGTIASRAGRSGLTPVIAASELLSYVPELTEKVGIDAVDVCRVDSTDMTPSHWIRIVEAIRDSYGAYDGFVVCHGTDTMAYTSAALSYMIQNARKPVVITGSQKPIDIPGSDARANLTDAVVYASDPQSEGVCIVFGGSVIAGTRAKKTRARSFNAFSSINYPYLASIQDGRILRYISPAEPDGPVSFYTDLCESVFVLKLTPGTRPDILEYLFRSYDCLVIESFGLGGIPAAIRDEFCRQMDLWVSRGKIIVIATQVENEGSNMEIYEVGNLMKSRFRLIESYDMTLEAAITKLMVLLPLHRGRYEEIRRAFYRTVNHDILYPACLPPAEET